MKRNIIFAALSLLLIPILLIPIATAADDPVQIEKDAVKLLYSTGKDIASYADTMNPMLKGKWTEESKNVLSMKISYLKLASNAMAQIADDSSYKANPEALAFADTYGKAVTAKTRIDAEIKDLEAYQNGDVLENGELDGSGLLWDDKYNNDDFKTKLKELDETKIDDNDTWYDTEGDSKWMWILIILFVVIGYFSRNKLGSITRPFTDSLKDNHLFNKKLEESDKTLFDLIKKLRSLLASTDDELKTVTVSDETRYKVKKEIERIRPNLEEENAIAKEWKVGKVERYKLMKKLLKGIDNKKLKTYIKDIANTLDKIDKELTKREKIRENYEERYHVSLTANSEPTNGTTEEEEKEKRTEENVEN